VEDLENADAKSMHSDGLLFFHADNGAWLTDIVPPDVTRRHDIGQEINDSVLDVD